MSSFVSHEEEFETTRRYFTLLAVKSPSEFYMFLENNKSSFSAEEYFWVFKRLFTKFSMSKDVQIEKVEEAFLKFYENQN